MNDHDMVVGVTNDGFAFRWQPPYTLAYLHVPFGYTNPYPFHVTNSGYITGTVRSSFSRARYTIRWAPNGTPTVFSAGPSYPAGLHDNGDVLLATFYGSYQTLIWPASGSVRSVTGIPGTPVAAWSSAGRYAGDFGPSQTREPWTLYNGSLTWLPAGDLNTQLVDVVDENACGTIIATRDLFATPVTEDSGYMWRRLFTCDLSGTLAGGTSVASPSTAALP